MFEMVGGEEGESSADRRSGGAQRREKFWET